MTAALTTRPDADDGPQGWRVRVACRGATDPERFFPVTSPGRTTRRELGAIAETARTYCQACPVRARCRAYADETRSEGVWGGEWWRRNNGSGRMVALPLLARGAR